MMAKRIMIQGTMSGVGKSLLCAALCRIFRQDGLRAAPFKSQNMALNSYVTADGLEMGRAQAVQAEAAGIRPDVRMNPVLLKPSSDTGSQVIVMGRARGHMHAAEYFRYRKSLFPEILAAYGSLAAEYDVIVIEGAGSPAEINLRRDDIVNMGLAERLDAPVLLAGDIDRGGVFAQLYGTVALLPPEERARVRGLVINQFRGDAALLKPGLAPLEALTGVPVLGVVPCLPVHLDSEDSLCLPRSGTADLHSGAGDSARRTDSAGMYPREALDIAIIRLPRISNFTDFAPLERHPLTRIRYIDSAARLGRPDMVVLPGTKSAAADLLWMRENGLERAVLRLAALDTPVLGVCGGYQMLGERIDDPAGAESPFASLPGMGLLPCRTVFRTEKTLARTAAVVAGGPLDGARLDGYEIHMGATERIANTGGTETGGEPFCRLENGRFDGCRRGNVMGTYLHGLFDSGELAEKLAAWLCTRKGIAAGRGRTGNGGALRGGTIEPAARYQERQYDLLAEGVRAALDMDAVYRIMGETL